MTYPVSLTVPPLLTNRNRLTTFFRLILAIPHMILVGSGGIGVAYQSGNMSTRGGFEGGLLGAVAFFLAIVSWFTIVFTGTHIIGIRQFCGFYLRWRARAHAYVWLLEDAYPPFGDAPYSTTLDIADPVGPRERLTVAFRLPLIIPHAIVLAFLMLAWGLTSIIAWFAILFTGSYPRALYDFAVGTLRWRLRVEAYMLLMVDDYPPFSFE